MVKTAFSPRVLELTREEAMKRISRFLAAAAVLAMPEIAQAANLITNGDFESGNSGFTSDYLYSPASNNDEGQYTVRSDPWPWNGNFVSIGDHTSGSGLMMVVNGSPNAGDVVWNSGSIAIDSNTNYFFEAFVANVCCSGGGVNPPLLTFSVSLDGGAFSDLVTLGVPENPVGQWIGLSSNFNSGSASTAVVRLVNANTVRAGNDFAVDDIHLGKQSVVIPVPEPASWVMMIAGFGLAGGVVRNKRRKSALSCA